MTHPIKKTSPSLHSDSLWDRDLDGRDAPGCLHRGNVKRSESKQPDAGGNGSDREAIEREPIFGRLLICCLISAFVLPCLPLTFLDLAEFGYRALAWIFLAATSRVRAVRWIYSGGAIGFTIILICALPEAFPLHTRIRGVRFNNAPIATVLQHIAQQRTSYPAWWFYLCDEETANAKITAHVADGSSLPEALDTIARAAGCTYEWGWSKLCGTAGRPDCARFRFRRVGVPVIDPFDWVVFIHQRGIMKALGRPRR